MVMKTNRSIAVLLSVLTSMSLLCACKEERVQKTVSFEGTFATTNEVLNPAPSLKQRITGLSQDKPEGINKFVAVSTLTIAPPPPFKLGGECTFSAENGDSFTTTFEGTSVPNADGTSTVEMTHTIKSGTGKFEKASGTFVGNTVADPKKLPAGSITYKGTITY